MRLIEMMGGRIWLESEVGRGSTFHFTANFGVAGMLHHAPRWWILRFSTTARSDRGRQRHQSADSGTNAGLLAHAPHCGVERYGCDQFAHEAKAAGVPFGLLVADCHMPDVDGFMLVEQIQRSPDLSSLVTIMLTSGGQRGDGLRCRELGIAAYLIKPVLQADLLDALLQVLASCYRVVKPTQVITRHTLRAAPSPLRILLAEDNLVNQKLASRLLENQGHMVIVAGDGAQALDTLAKQSFDLILMDAQMPVMDGFEATAAIRRLEEQTRAHIPIIAMTAHAMVGDRQRCLKAGMDGYIAKPVHAHELFETIESVLAAQPVHN